MKGWYPRDVCSSFQSREGTCQLPGSKGCMLMHHNIYESHTLMLSPFTLIACEAGSVFQTRWLCLREIVICLRSGHVGAEDQVSDSFSPVAHPDLSRGFCCQWKVERTSLLSLPTWFVAFAIFLCGSLGSSCEDRGPVSCCSNTGGPSRGLLREHILWRERGQSCSWKLCSLRAADEGCWHSPLPNLAELSSSLISARACEIFWLGSLHKAIFPVGSHYTTSLVPFADLHSKVCAPQELQVEGPRGAQGSEGPRLIFICWIVSWPRFLVLTAGLCGKNADFGVPPFGSMESWEITLPLSSPYSHQTSSFDKAHVSIKAGVGGRGNEALPIILVIQL